MQINRINQQTTFGYNRTLNKELINRLNDDTEHNKIYINNVRRLNNLCNSAEHNLRTSVAKNSADQNILFDIFVALKSTLAKTVEEHFPELNFAKREAKNYYKEDNAIMIKNNYNIFDKTWQYSIASNLDEISTHNALAKCEKNNIDEAYAPFLEENLEIKIDTYKPFYEYCFVTRDASNTYSHNLNHQQLELVWENSFTIPQADSIVKDRIKYVSFTHGLYDYGGNVKNIEMNIYDGKESLLGKYTASPYEDIVVPIDDIITTKEKNIKLKIKLFAQSYSLLDKVYVGPAYCKLKDYQYLPWNIFFKK